MSVGYEGPRDLGIDIYSILKFHEQLIHSDEPRQKTVREKELVNLLREINKLVDASPILSVERGVWSRTNVWNLFGTDPNIQS